MNWIDTAAYYGFGHAEEVVARALRGLHERPHVFTKCGLVPAISGPEAHEFCLKAASVRREVEDSLARLQTDVIDLVMLHWPIPDADVEEGWATLAALKQEGKVRCIGVSNFAPAQLVRCEEIAPVEVVQPEYSLAERTAEEALFPWLEHRGVGAIVYSPLKHGLLSGSMDRGRIAALDPSDWRHGHEQYTEPRLTRNLEIVEVLTAVGRRHGRSAAEVAVAWTLCRPAVAGAIVGARRAAQVESVTAAADLVLSDEDMAQLERPPTAA
jgi:aryl-alcohol dehydrogenase-like predicted oxidoreductase